MSFSCRNNFFEKLVMDQSMSIRLVLGCCNATWTSLCNLLCGLYAGLHAAARSLGDNILTGSILGQKSFLFSKFLFFAISQYEPSNELAFYLPISTSSDFPVTLSELASSPKTLRVWHCTAHIYASFSNFTFEIFIIFLSSCSRGNIFSVSVKFVRLERSCLKSTTKRTQFSALF